MSKTHKPITRKQSKKKREQYKREQRKRKHTSRHRLIKLFDLLFLQYCDLNPLKAHVFNVRAAYFTMLNHGYSINMELMQWLDDHYLDGNGTYRSAAYGFAPVDSVFTCSTGNRVIITDMYGLTCNIIKIV